MTPHQLATILEPAFYIAPPTQFAITVALSTLVCLTALIGCIIAQSWKVLSRSERRTDIIFAILLVTLGTGGGAVFAYQLDVSVARNEARIVAGMLQAPGLEVRQGQYDGAPTVELVLGRPASTKLPSHAIGEQIMKIVALSPADAERADSILQKTGHGRLTLFR